MIRRELIVLVAACMSGCATEPGDIAREPHLTPVGSGLRPDRVAIDSKPAPRPAYHRDHSLWQDASADLFRDPRALKVGDVVTVKISIKDKASLDNTTNRKRDSTRNFSVDFNYALSAEAEKQHQVKGNGLIDSSAAGKTETKGEGVITRSESIDLRVAAVVTDILPNGNLVVSGTQEVRVNFEVRVLSVAGIVRPRDIASDNSISYDKIAEARISYGGRGRIMEVQQPAWGHQIVDLLSPF